MTRSFATVSISALLVALSSTAAWAGNCACGINDSCGSGFSKCHYDDGGNCIDVSGPCTPIRTSMIPGSEAITVVHAAGTTVGDSRFALAGCSRTLAERSYTASEAEALRASTRDLSV